MMYREKVLFAIDDDHDVHTVAKFTRHLDTAKALGHLNAPVVLCIGCWRGVLENSYLMDRVDYERFVLPIGFTAEQEAVMYVPGDTRQPCTLEYLNGDRRSVGRLNATDAATALSKNAWTYVPASNTYFITDI